MKSTATSHAAIRQGSIFVFSGRHVACFLVSGMTSWLNGHLIRKDRELPLYLKTYAIDVHVHGLQTYAARSRWLAASNL